MLELINKAQEAIDNDDMEAYECIQQQIRELYRSEELGSK